MTQFAKLRSLFVIAILAFGLSAVPRQVHALGPGEALADPKLEARARATSQLLRCVVCQNQSIDDSNAPLAKDLRVLLRERISAGDSDDAAIAYIVARYGNFVLLKPPFQFNTLLLWFGPALLMLIAGTVFVRSLRRISQPPDAGAPAETFSDDEQERIEKLLREGSST